MRNRAARIKTARLISRRRGLASHAGGMPLGITRLGLRSPRASHGKVNEVPLDARSTMRSHGAM
jgi:hypothetical protein